MESEPEAGWARQGAAGMAISALSGRDRAGRVRQSSVRGEAGIRLRPGGGLKPGGGCWPLASPASPHVLYVRSSTKFAVCPANKEGLSPLEIANEWTAAGWPQVGRRFAAALAGITARFGTGCLEAVSGCGCCPLDTFRARNASLLSLIEPGGPLSALSLGGLGAAPSALLRPLLTGVGFTKPQKNAVNA